jgi:DNA-binding transcriptional MerR regulator
MKYKAKEVSRITGIPVDTLRYFEKIGVISPKIDESNNYRYYSAWDINFLFEYLNYKKLEYSSKDLIQYIHHASLEEQIEMMEKQCRFFQEKLEHYHMLYEQSNNHLNKIQDIEGRLNKIEFKTMPEYKYILYRQNYYFYNSKTVSKEFDTWLGCLGLLENVVIIPQEIIESQGDNMYFWGLMLRKDWYEKHKIQDSENTRTIKSVLCINTLVEAFEEGTFNYHLLDHALAFIEEHNFKLSGDPFGILLTRSHDEQGIHRYIDFYLPISYD